MRPALLLRIAAVLTLLYALGHTSGFPWTPGEGAEATSVVDAMQRQRFDVMGSSRSYGDFYVGFGLIISTLMFAEAVLLWFLAGLAKTDARRLRPLIATFAIAYAINAVLGWKYFFAVPLVFAVAIALTLTWAFVTASRETASALP